MDIKKGEGVIVKTGDGSVILTEVKPENKKAKECWNMLRWECDPLCCYESIMRELRNITEK